MDDKIIKEANKYKTKTEKELIRDINRAKRRKQSQLKKKQKILVIYPDGERELQEI